MPAAETTAPPGGKRSTKLLQLLFYGGVGLSPLAALLLLVGSGFVLQVAAVLAVIVVVLIGLSIALRHSGDSVRTEVEEIVYDEIDSLREDIRGDISHAARATHGQLMERIGTLHETVDGLRHQVDVLRGQLERAAAQPPPAPHPTGSASVPQGVLRHTETVQVTTKTMVVDPTEARSGTVYGAGPGMASIPQQRRPERAERGPGRPDERDRAHDRGHDRQQDRGHDRAQDRGQDRGYDRGHERDRAGERGRPDAWGDRHQDEYDDRREPGRGERAERIGRSERTEWTERSERSERSEWVERAPHREEPREEPRHESWTEQLLRERMARSESGAWPQHSPRDAQRGEHSGEVERRGGGRRRAKEPDDEDNVTGMRTTDRWASVHSDERGGRELRMGERRAAVHADETGTHVRIEDRWASVRQEEYYPDEPRSGGHRADDDRRGGGRHGGPDDRDERGADRHDSDRHSSDRHGSDRHDSDRHDSDRYSSGTESPRRSAASRERERDWTDPERTGGGHRRAEAHWSQSSYEEARRDDSGATRWSEVRRERPALGGSQAALPAAPAEPASRWTSGLGGQAGGREDERVSRRSRVEDDDEYGWNGGRDEHRGGRAPRQIVDFEGSDDRWR